MDDNSKKSLFYCTLLALQFGLQPMIASRFTAKGVSKSSVVIATELGKIIIAVISILGGPSAEREKIFENWSLANSLKVAAVPATLYAIQNLFVQYGYVLLDSMTFNLLNQTKTLSAALWLYIIMGKKQSGIQMVALFMLLVAAILLNLGGGSTDGPTDVSSYNYGLLMVAGASMLSGLSASLTQRALVSEKPRHPLFFSAELAVYGIGFLLLNLVFNSDTNVFQDGLFNNWDLMTLIPVTLNAFGGLVVGLVTKYAGGVVKGFALIAGILVTAVAQFLVDGKPLGMKHLFGILLVSASIYLHSSFPYKSSKPSTTDKEKIKKNE